MHHLSVSKYLLTYLLTYSGMYVCSYMPPIHTTTGLGKVVVGTYLGR